MKDLLKAINAKTRELAREINGLARRADDDALQGTERKTEGMSVLDKLKIWETYSGREPTNFEGDEVFPGLNDSDICWESDSEVDIQETPTIQLVRNSSAFDWFISSLKRDFSYSRDGIESWSSMRLIRSTVLSCFSQGRVSRHQAPKLHSATFLVPWELALSHHNLKSVSLGEVLAATSSGTQTLLCSVGRIRVENLAHDRSSTRQSFSSVHR